MRLYRLYNRLSKCGALVAAALVLPGLAFAGTDNGKGNGGQNNGNQVGKVPVVPETNAGWVLVPFLGVVLLFSARRFYRSRVDQKSGG
jgi:hypothetical protein